MKAMVTRIAREKVRVVKMGRVIDLSNQTREKARAKERIVKVAKMTGAAKAKVKAIPGVVLMAGLHKRGQNHLR